MGNGLHAPATYEHGASMPVQTVWRSPYRKGGGASTDSVIEAGLSPVGGAPL